MEPLLPPESEEMINDLLVDTFNLILKYEARSLQEGSLLPLSINEIHTLDAIGLSEARNMGEIAERLGISTATLTVAIDRLVHKGYVERRRMPDDRRVVLATLTGKGRRAYRIHRLYHQNMVRAALQGLTAPQVDALAEALSHIKEFFENGEGDKEP